MAEAKKIPLPARGHRKGDAKELRAELNPNMPVFPYPPDLLEKYQPFWLEAVNAKTADYWSRSDIPLLKMYCRCASDVERLSQEIEEEGEVIRNAKGNPVVNPKIVIRGFAEGRLMALCTRLRMQPSSRVDSRQEGKNTAKKRSVKATAQVVADDEDGLLAGAGDLDENGNYTVQ